MSPLVYFVYVFVYLPSVYASQDKAALHAPLSSLAFSALASFSPSAGNVNPVMPGLALAANAMSH